MSCCFHGNYVSWSGEGKQSPSVGHSPSPWRTPSRPFFRRPRGSRQGSPPTREKHSFLLMKRKRTANATMKTPTADRKPMASGVTGRRRERERGHTMTHWSDHTNRQSGYMHAHTHTHTHTHTVRMVHVIHTDRMSDTLVFELPSVLCSRAESVWKQLLCSCWNKEKFPSGFPGLNQQLSALLKSTWWVVLLSKNWIGKNVNSLHRSLLRLHTHVFVILIEDFGSAVYMGCELIRSGVYMRRRI